MIEYLYEGPIVSVGEVQKLAGTTFPAANQLVGKLVGILTQSTGQSRNRRLRCQKYIDLFAGP